VRDGSYDYFPQSVNDVVKYTHVHSRVNLFAPGFRGPDPPRTKARPDSMAGSVRTGGATLVRGRINAAGLEQAR
jgi:hypothetical protein